MTRNDIIRMAEEACNGKQLEYFNGWGVVFDHDQLERFAELVAAAEREACAQVAEEMGNIDGNMNKTWRNGCFDVAFAIRERGAS